MKEKTRERFEQLVRRCPYIVQKIFFSRRNEREYKAWIKAEKPLPPPRRIKENAIGKYKSITGYDTLVETGTYRGDMVFAQLTKFKKIYSIELDDKLYKAAASRFRSFPHVKILHGDSGKVLTHIIKELKSPAVFWLDGHYSSGITALGDKTTPIYEELQIIFSQNLNHAILIDDARLFTGSDGYPTLDDLKKYIHQFRPGQQIEVGDDCIQISLKSMASV
jgi:hypothetical protein